MERNEKTMRNAKAIRVTKVGEVTEAGAIPAAVPMWSTPIGVLAHRGTVHSVLITPPGSCNPGGATNVTDSFDIQVKTPKNVVSSTRVFVNYKN